MHDKNTRKLNPLTYYCLDYEGGVVGRWRCTAGMWKGDGVQLIDKWRSIAKLRKDGRVQLTRGWIQLPSGMVEG